MTTDDRFSRRRFVATTSGALAAGALAGPAAWAQAAKFPNRPIKVLVAFPPGGLTDAYARMYADQLSTALGVTTVVENRPGGGGVIAIDALAKSPPDGYTLLFTTSGTVWQNRVLYTKLPYNLDKDIAPIAVFPSGPLVVGVAGKVPARNMKEFIEYARRTPCSMGTYAPGSFPHMVADQLNRSMGTKIQVVHYKGEAAMWVDVASGNTEVAVGSYQAYNTVSTRGVKPIGVTGSYRSPKLPDVSTVPEQGLDARLFALEGGLPLLAPGGTPEAVLQVLSKVVVDGANTERAAKLRENFGIPNKPKNLAGTRADWDRDVPVWVKVAVDLNVKLD
jgi:tripartite-type tricarboxylate transporter receptor subunit TctC